MRLKRQSNLSESMGSGGKILPVGFFINDVDVGHLGYPRLTSEARSAKVRVLCLLDAHNQVCLFLCVNIALEMGDAIEQL